MKIKEWWKHMLSKFGGNDKDPENDRETEPDSGQAVELFAEEAPEPVPERKTSDEMIVQMAESTLEGEGRTAPPAEERAEEKPEDSAVQDAEDHAEAAAPEFDDWEEEAVPEYEDETDGIREE